MAFHEIDPLLDRIRTLVADIDQLEGDGVDERLLAGHRRQLAHLKSLLAKVVSHDPAYDYSAAA
jgi:hypothetical protein